jgi:hypothetical protein
MSKTNHMKILNIDPITSPENANEFNIHAMETGGTRELNLSISRSSLERLAQVDALYGYTVDAENDSKSAEILQNALSFEG